MERRDFLKLMAATAMLPATAGMGLFRAEAALPHVFFDERFPEARRLAAVAGQGAVLTPVRADVTRVWLDTLKPLAGRAPLALVGVTTESFYFCLKTLLQSEGRVRADVRRADKDLYAWAIRMDATEMRG